MKKSIYSISKKAGLVIFLLSTISLMACTASRVDWDKAGMRETKKVAVVLFTVPPTINFLDDPQDRRSIPFLAKVANEALGKTGGQAATLAHKGFIEELNKSGLRFSVMTPGEMMANKKFKAVLAKYAIPEVKEEPKKDEGLMGTALSFFGSGGDDNAGIGPEGYPNFGLAPGWSSQPSALMNAEKEMDYIKESIKALGVDAVIAVNDPGLSYGCEFCIGGTGSGTTGSAFLISFIDSEGEGILEMRQWFFYGGSSIALVAYVANPLQLDTLYNGHGTKMAQVFSEYYKEEGGK